jgi:acyl-CoA synthetase (AMP-forming)/AMP-acid ligase II
MYVESTKTDMLVAYIVSEHADEQTGKTICDTLAQHLTDYQIPRIFYFVKEFMFTPRGKLIRDKLYQLKPIYCYRPID